MTPDTAVEIQQMIIGLLEPRELKIVAKLIQALDEAFCRAEELSSTIKKDLRKKSQCDRKEPSPIEILLATLKQRNDSWLERFGKINIEAVGKMLSQIPSLSETTSEALNRIGANTFGTLCMTDRFLLKKQIGNETIWKEVETLLDKIDQIPLCFHHKKANMVELNASKENILGQSVIVLRLPTRVNNCLEYWSISPVKTIGDLCQKRASELCSIRCFGKTSLRQVRLALGNHGLHLKDEEVYAGWKPNV